MVVLDAMEKTAHVRVLQTELNDSPGVCMKLYGLLADVQAAAEAAETTARAMQTSVIVHVIPGPSDLSRRRLRSTARFQPADRAGHRTKPEGEYERPIAFRCGTD